MAESTSPAYRSLLRIGIILQLPLVLIGFAIYIASADLMPRNLDHRVELAVPIETPALREELLDVLERAFADNQSSWDLDAEGNWQRNSPRPGERPRSLQLELAELYGARARSARHSAERDADPLGAGRL